MATANAAQPLADDLDANFGSEMVEMEVDGAVQKNLSSFLAKTKEYMLKKIDPRAGSDVEAFALIALYACLVGLMTFVGWDSL